MVELLSGLVVTASLRHHATVRHYQNRRIYLKYLLIHFEIVVVLSVAGWWYNSFSEIH